MRNLVICAEDSDAAAQACEWAVNEVYREGDRIHLVYVALALKAPMTVSHGPPGTSYEFSQPGRHLEETVIKQAREEILARYLPILKTKMCSYELHLYADQQNTSAEKVGSIIMKCVEERDAVLVVMAAHNKPNVVDKFQGALGGVAKYLTSNCTRPLAVIHPKSPTE